MGKKGAQVVPFVMFTPGLTCEKNFADDYRLLHQLLCYLSIKFNKYCVSVIIIEWEILNGYYNLDIIS